MIEGCSGGSYSDRSFYLPDGRKLDLISSGSFQCGNIFKLEYSNLPILISQSNPNAFRFKMDEKAEFEIDGNLVPLSKIVGEGRSMSFRHLKIKNASFNLLIDGSSGRIKLQDGVILLESAAMTKNSP